MIALSQLLSALEKRVPSGASEKWDNVGLLAGDPRWRTRRAVVSIDLTEDAIRLARRSRAGLIVCHHPCIFPASRGWTRFVPSPGAQELVFECVRRRIAVAVFHTSFDRCALEVVETVSRGLGVVPRGRLHEKPDGALLKLSVFVPVSHLEQVRRAVCDAGAGVIGDYDQCAFFVEGTGTFRGSAGTRPFLGKPGALEIVREARLETILPRGLQGGVLAALRRAHPYEEIAYDLYPVEQAPTPQGLVRGLGYGFWGEFPRPKSFSELAQSVKRLFAVSEFWVSQPVPGRVKRIAFAAGKGADFIASAASSGCEVMITGEAGYHGMLDGARRGMAVVELGHRESERFFLRTMEGWLRAEGLGVGISDRPTQALWTAKIAKGRRRS